MPWLTMYLVDPDVNTLCAMLCDDPDVALIRADGPGRWKAQREIPTLPDGEHGLWHIPSGPIELHSTVPKAPPKVVKDPFRGWKEIVTPRQPGVPWISTGALASSSCASAARRARRHQPSAPIPTHRGA